MASMMSRLSLGLERLLQEHSSGDTSDNGPGSIGDGVGAVDVVASGSWAGSSAVGALATPGSHGDSAGGGDWSAGWCNGGAGGGNEPASLDVIGHGGTDESRSNSDEAHFEIGVLFD